jgi:hypothetical protein
MRGRTKTLGVSVPTGYSKGRRASDAAALVTGSWVGRVRVVGAAGVIDALVTWQKTIG